MDDSRLRALLEKAGSIAVIGANDRPGRPVDRVGRYLIAWGYRVIPVHPARKTVWGLPCFANLANIPEPVDIVNVFRAPEHCPEHAREALRLSPPPKIFWMQLGICSREAVSLLAGQGVPVVEDACLMVEHLRLFG